MSANYWAFEGEKLPYIALSDVWNKKIAQFYWTLNLAKTCLLSLFSTILVGSAE